MNMLTSTFVGTKNMIKGYLKMNDTIEFDKNLTKKDKKGKMRVLVYRSNPADKNDDPKFVSYYIKPSSDNMMYL